jgi:hypothetical protein
MPKPIQRPILDRFRNSEKCDHKRLYEGVSRPQQLERQNVVRSGHFKFLRDVSIRSLMGLRS